MGVAGRHFAHGKRSPGRRTGLAAVLEDSQMICAVMVAVGSMIMIGLRLYNDLMQ
jgi:hypothetical protein